MAKKTLTLPQYLQKYGIKQKHFAKEIGTTDATISRIVGQGYAPSLKMAIDIEKYTKGEISVYSWDLSKTAHCVKPEANDDHKKENCDT